MFWSLVTWSSKYLSKIAGLCNINEAHCCGTRQVEPGGDGGEKEGTGFLGHVCESES